MGLKNLLFKPRWRNKNAAIRARAVAESDDAELVNQLSNIARSDAESEVRLAALKRVDHLDTLFAIACGDSAESVSDYAWRQVMQQLETSDVAKSALDIVNQIDHPDRITRLAKKAQSVQVRGAAQEKINREGLLGDIAIADPDPDLRLQAASRVTSESTLKRITEKVRRTDKKLFRVLNERLQAMQVASGDTTIVADRAVALCQEMETLARADLARTQRSAELNRLTQSFGALKRESKLPSDLSLRFDNAARIAEATLTDPKEDPLAPLRAELAGFTARTQQAISANALDDIRALLRSFADLDEKLVAADASLHDELSEQLDRLTQKRDELLAGQRPDPTLSKLCDEAEKPGRRSQRSDHVTTLRAQWQAAVTDLQPLNDANRGLKQRFDQALKILSERQSKESEKREQAALAFTQHLNELEPLLENGDLHKAAALAQKAVGALNRAGKKHPESGRLTQLRSKIQEMRQWQHWANDEVRQRLVEHAAAIPGSGMHPDAMAARVKELRARWKELDQGERLPGDPPNKPLSAKLFAEFQTACEAAFEPARPFFEKRAEVRGKHLEELNALCEKLATVAPDGDNWDVISKAVGEARGSLRRLSEVPHKERAGLASRLRKEADRLDEALQGQYEVVERRKRKIIEEVTALIDEPDLAKAVEAAKGAQLRWKEAGRLRRGLDQKLWKQYRAAADKVFGRLDEQRQQARAEQQASRSQLETLITEAEKLDSSSPEFGSERDQLHQRWREAGAGDRRLQQKFSDLIEAAEEGARNHLAAKTTQHRKQLRDLEQRCHEAEQHRLADDAGKDDDTLDAGETDINKFDGLNARVQTLQQSGCPWQDDELHENLKRLQNLCVQAEFLAGIETPQSFHDARMRYQVQRLSDRMSGDSAMSLNEEADHIEGLWLGCGPLPATADSESSRSRMRLALIELDAQRP